MEIRKKVVELYKSLIITDDEATDIEIGVYNFSIDYATEHLIPLTWSSDVFKELYVNKARGLYSNLNSNLSIKNDRLLKRLNDKEFLPH